MSVHIQCTSGNGVIEKQVFVAPPFRVASFRVRQVVAAVRSSSLMIVLPAAQVGRFARDGNNFRITKNLKTVPSL